MLRKTMWEDYQEWLFSTYYICRRGYDLLLKKLMDTPFVVVLDRDSNRLGDAEFFRDLYFNKKGISGSFIDHPISVLEVILSLAVRMDSEYVGNPVDPHPEIIFWDILRNLGVDECDNRHFNGDYIDKKMYVFLNRMYDFDGFGGIFPLKNPKNDQKTVEIWNQAMAYLSENYV